MIDHEKRKARLRKAQKTWREKHPDQALSKNRAYYQANKDKWKDTEAKPTRQRWRADYERKPSVRHYRRQNGKKHWAKTNYGKWADAFLVMMELRQETYQPTT